MTLAVLAPFIALAGALINGLFGRFLKEPLPGIIGAAAVAAGFVCSVASFLQLLAMDVPSIHVKLWSFMSVGDMSLDVAFTVDSLSIIMMMIITGVGTLIHLYSISYMHGDKGFSRYFMALNLFVAAMLVLVLADSYPLMFVGWEGVGVCSFLLIGFWYGDKLNVDAARKAFIVNRIGDVGFLLAMFMMYKAFGTLTIAGVNAGAVALGASGAITLICIFLMVAASGKSAQLPLHVWLPDAMAGPTPVSALIHAATMVTAGVYLVARSGPLFVQSPVASAVVAWIGAITALVAAFSAMSQKDIKGILAYSTISQLGYMFVAVGTGAYWVGIFHVFTHAFFKALLFLVSGSVIHALHGEQNIDKMGGLKKYMPTTSKMALVATLAISGVPLLSGFFSKDTILLKALTSNLIAPFGGGAIYFILLVTAAMTAFYMFRWYHCVFEGEERLTPEAKAHVHESPVLMTMPLVILAFFSIFSGYLGLPEAFAPNWFSSWLKPVTGHASFWHPSLMAELALMGLSILMAFLGLGLAYWVYGIRKGEPADGLRTTGLGQSSANALGFDAAYKNVFTRPAEKVAANLSDGDTSLGGGFRNIGLAFGGFGLLMRFLQQGFVRAYALLMFAGLVIMIVYLALSGGGA